MRYATVCSGIEAPSVAWEPLGWEPVWFSEIEKFPSAVLAHHYPHVPNLGDMTKIHENEKYQSSRGAIDVFCGGTPCQSFSVAGLRKGLADPRGNLALHFLRIVDEIRPRWVVWENVPGVLSSSGGRDFGAFLGGLGQLGYGWAYRVLDAQYFGVPQRRRRVFVVGYLGGWQRAAAVLFDAESLRRDTPPRRIPGAPVAPLIANGIGASGADDNQAQAGHIIAGALCAGDFKSVSDQQAENGKIIACIKGAAIGRQPKNGPQRGDVLEDGTTYTLNCTEQHAVCFQAKASARTSMNPSYVSPTLDIGKAGYMAVFQQNQRGEVREMPMPGSLQAEPGMQQQNYLHSGAQVRRLTPVECERLQGFPDGYTDIPGYGGSNGVPDGPRYRALGNSMAVPAMRWIGERIEMV